MRKKTVFYVILSFYFLVMILDVLLTYLGTPDLTYEANPLVSVFGLGWISLIAANIFISLAYIYLVRYAVLKYEPPFIEEEKFTRYISQLYYNRPDKFVWTLYKKPKNFKPLLAIIGFAYAFAIPAGRTVVLFEWICVLNKTRIDPYLRFRETIPFGRVDILVCLILTALLMVFWILNDYYTNRKQVIKTGAKAVTAKALTTLENA